MTDNSDKSSQEAKATARTLVNAATHRIPLPDATQLDIADIKHVHNIYLDQCKTAFSSFSIPVSKDLLLEHRGTIGERSGHLYYMDALDTLKMVDKRIYGVAAHTRHQALISAGDAVRDAVWKGVDGTELDVLSDKLAGLLYRKDVPFSVMSGPVAAKEAARRYRSVAVQCKEQALGLSLG